MPGQLRQSCFFKGQIRICGPEGILEVCGSARTCTDLPTTSTDRSSSICGLPLRNHVSHRSAKGTVVGMHFARCSLRDVCRHSRHIAESPRASQTGDGFHSIQHCGDWIVIFKFPSALVQNTDDCGRILSAGISKPVTDTSSSTFKKSSLNRRKLVGAN